MATTRRGFLGFVGVVLVGGLLLGSIPVAEARPPYDTYAAIAFSQSTGRYGYSRNFTSLDEARIRAVEACGVYDARVIGWVKNGYIALALGDRLGAYGWGWSSSESAARSRALSEASMRTNNCYIAVCVRSYY